MRLKAMIVQGEHRTMTEDEFQTFIFQAKMQEREACAKLTVSKSQCHAECDYRGMMDPETGEIPCSNRNGCLCDELANHGDMVAKAIRERKP